MDKNIPSPKHNVEICGQIEPQEFHIPHVAATDGHIVQELNVIKGLNKLNARRMRTLKVDSMDMATMPPILNLNCNMVPSCPADQQLMVPVLPTFHKHSSTPLKLDQQPVVRTEVQEASSLSRKSISQLLNEVTVNGHVNSVSWGDSEKCESTTGAGVACSIDGGEVQTLANMLKAGMNLACVKYDVNRHLDV